MRSMMKALVLALLVASPLAAQAKPQTRQGFTISFGLGGGSAGLSCSDCSSDREGAGSGYFRIGGTFRPNLILGAEFSGWTKSATDQGSKVTTTLSFATGIAQWYPQPATGFYLKGGLGIGGISADVVDPFFGSATMESMGVAGLIGAGYDWRVGQNFSLSPYINFMGSGGAKAKVNGSSTGETLNANLFQFGLGFTWH
jgi:hypothetical protein